MDNWRPNPAAPELWARCRDAARTAGVSLDWNGAQFVTGRWPSWSYEFYDTPAAVAAVLRVEVLPPAGHLIQLLLDESREAA